MSQTPALMNTLKRELKARGITYAHVASELDLSESSIKRLFSSANVSLARLEQMCQLVGLELSDLVQKMSGDRARIDQLTVEQEREVAEDPKLLLVATCVLNHWTFDEILDAYELDEHECIQLLVKLDRLKIIDLLPRNRFKVIVASDFRWIANGPIQNFFRREVQQDYMHSSFTAAGEKLVFRSGMLSRGSNATMMKKMEKLIAEFGELHDEDIRLPLAERFGTSIMVAMRPWEFSYFRELRRQPNRKIFS
jgi:transcriptional regulator with XRE-family HTH domain